MAVNNMVSGGKISCDTVNCLSITSCHFVTNIKCCQNMSYPNEFSLNDVTCCDMVSVRCDVNEKLTR